MTDHRQFLFPAAGQAELVACDGPGDPLPEDGVEGRTLFTAASPGTELNVYLGNYMKQGIAWGTLPFVPGYAACMVVERVGDAVDDLEPGDVAFCMGLHRSWQRFPRDEVVKAPAGCDPRLVPLARLMTVTMSTLTQTAARPPGPVAVTGLGPIGMLGALAFKAAGYRVLACDPLPERVALAAQVGLEAVDALPLHDPAHAGRYEAVVECSAHERAMIDGIKLLRGGGELSLVGVPMTPKCDASAQELANAIFRGPVVVRSGNEWQVPLHPTGGRRGSIFGPDGQLATALRWLAEGTVPAEPLIGVIPPDDPQGLYQDLLHRRHPALIPVIDWAG